MTECTLDIPVCLHCGQYLITAGDDVVMCDGCVEDGHHGEFYIDCDVCRHAFALDPIHEGRAA